MILLSFGDVASVSILYRAFLAQTLKTRILRAFLKVWRLNLKIADFLSLFE